MNWKYFDFISSCISEFSKEGIHGWNEDDHNNNFLSGWISSCISGIWRRVVMSNHQCCCCLIWMSWRRRWRRSQLKFLHLEDCLQHLSHSIQLFINLTHLKNNTIIVKISKFVSFFSKKGKKYIYLIFQSVQSCTNGHRFDVALLVNTMVVVSRFTKGLIKSSL